MRKLCSKGAPRLLTVDEKQQRINDSLRCLELFKRNKQDVLRSYVTMDETWIHSTRLNQNDRQLIEQQLVKVFKSDQKLKRQLARLLTTLRKAKQFIVNITWCYWIN
ncbi:hypothetical protein TNIN_236601 [Trichonephila inaurata madagascariensis]|uniref:Transposase n=1 Tax=Trichonephila inaurata madagascariensis TaxID=2747483 RepID=A0A8X6YX52_9ARAC|nr:hypothetical protein TNIN_236601 [Trichonephila inaurata madagascariensis]